nr:peptidylprolyl isomerase [Saprospiraceae bacterium]
MKYLMCFFLLTLASVVIAQDADVLFTIDDREVLVDEFEYIFKKNNPDLSQVNEEDVREYLDLYINFKLKVTRARELQIDTAASLNEELQTYRNQLSRTFLINKEVVEKLIQELFERKQEDINISHLLVALKSDATEDEIATAYEKAKALRKDIMDAPSFAEFAKEHSDDPTVERNGGNIGYVTAPLPDKFYAFETAIYETPVEELSMPVRSPMGYHIIKVNDRRPARGEVEVAQILIRTSGNELADEAAVEKLSEAITQLQQGTPFAEVAKEYSEDATTAQRGGYLGYVGINTFDQAFENAAFALANDGDYSAPVKTRIGYHIIQRLSTRPIHDLEKMKPILAQTIEDSERKEVVMENLIKRIKDEAGYYPNEEVMDDFIAGLTDEVFTYRWRVPEDLEDDVLFRIGDTPYMLSEFAEHLRRNTRQRLRMSTDTDIREGVMVIYKDFVGDATIRFHETQLEENNPEFRALMREYEEGILLFEINRIKVWDKATSDTVGLRKFYNRNLDRYMTEPQAKLGHFHVENASERQLRRIHKMAENQLPEDVLNKFDGRRNIKIQYAIEKTAKSKLPEYLKYEENYISEPIQTENQAYTFSKVIQLLDPVPRELERVKGFVIADYQEELERQWLNELKSRYKVSVHSETFYQMLDNLK